MSTPSPAPHPPSVAPADPAFGPRVRDSFARQPFMATLGASLGAVAPGRVELVLPFQDAVTQTLICLMGRNDSPAAAS